MAAGVVREFGRIRVETVHWPIVLVEYPPARVADEDFYQALAYLEQLMHESIAAREKSYFITDITRVREVPPASQRKHAADFVKRTAHAAKAGSLGTANVTPSSILRGILTAVYWLSPSPTPSAFFATRSEAYLHGIGVLEASGVPLPPGIRALRDQVRQMQQARPSPR